MSKFHSGRELAERCDPTKADTKSLEAVLRGSLHAKRMREMSRAGDIVIEQ